MPNLRNGRRLSASDVKFYNQVWLNLFFPLYRRWQKSGESEMEFAFKRAHFHEIADKANERRKKKKKNYSDIIWAFRNRIEWPAKITATAPPGMRWYLFNHSHDEYLFKVVRDRGLNEFHIDDMLAPRAYLDPLRKMPASVISSGSEQLFLTRVEKSGVLSHLLGVNLVKTENHKKRTSVFGSIEIDGLMAEEIGPENDHRKPLFAMVEVKGIGENISYEQVVHHYMLARHEHKDVEPHSVAIQMLSENVARILRFRCESIYECDVVDEWFVTFDGEFRDTMFQPPAVTHTCSCGRPLNLS